MEPESHWTKLTIRLEARIQRVRPLHQVLVFGERSSKRFTGKLCGQTPKRRFCVDARSSDFVNTGW